jgi:hypothetical protein
MTGANRGGRRKAKVLPIVHLEATPELSKEDREWRKLVLEMHAVTGNYH